MKIEKFVHQKKSPHDAQNITNQHCQKILSIPTIIQFFSVKNSAERPKHSPHYRQCIPF